MYEKDESIHLDGVLSRDEHVWAMKEFDAVVEKHAPRIRRAFVIYMLLSIVPWLFFPALIRMSSDTLMWIFIPLGLQMLNILGFIGYLRMRRKAARKALVNRAADINEHFAGRGVNFVVKAANDGGRQVMDKVVIEVAARNAQMPVRTSDPYAQSPQLYAAQPQQPGYVVVQQLPQNAVPLQNYAQAAPVYYGNASETDSEHAGLLRKM